MSVTDDLFEAIRSGMGAAVPFARHVGVELADVGDGVGRAVLADSPDTLNHVRTTHAGALFTLAEAASGAAMAGTFAEQLFDVRPVVSEATVRYRRPASGDLLAVARTGRPGAELRDELMRSGSVSFPVAVDVVDGQDRTVASLDVTWVVRSTV